jgi:hypothetical protein
MMANTFYWYVQTTEPGEVLVTAVYFYGFYGSGHGETILVDAYQDQTHVTTDAYADGCVSYHGHNVKYVDGSNMSHNGGGSEAVSNLVQAEFPIKIHYDCDASYAIQNAVFFAALDDDTGIGDDPTNMMVYAFELGDSAWTDIRASSGSELALDDKTAATDHYWYVAASVSPTAVGTHDDDGMFICQLEYY